MNGFWFEKYMRRIKPKERKIFCVVFILSVLVHAFVMTNHLANYDSVWYFHNDQNMTTSGRWFLQYAGGISSYFQIPALNGILSIFYISVTSIIVVKILEIDNMILSVLAGVTLAVYPTVAGIFNFMYAADAYFLAMLLAAVSAYLLTMRKWYYWIMGGGLLGLSMGIYQAFLSVTLVLLLLWIIKHTLLNSENVARYFVGMAVGLVTSIGVYVIGLKYRLHGGELESYQGIANSTLLHPLKWYWWRFSNSFKDIFRQIFVTDVYENKGIMVVVVCAWVITLVLFSRYLFSLFKRKKYVCAVFAVAAILLMPISVYCMNLLSEEVGYYGLMLSGISVVWLLPIVFLDCEIERDSGKLKGIMVNIMLICLCLNLWNYILVDNISYLASSVANDKTYALVERIVDRIEQTDGYSNMEYIYHYGNIDGELYTMKDFDGRSMINSGIIPYGNRTFGYYMGIYIRWTHVLTDEEKMLEIQNTQEFKDMPAWPMEGCTKLIDNVMVIKLAETE